VENSDPTARAAQPSVAAAAPVLSSVVPNSGSAAGGSTVTLNGSGFTGATSVAFGANPALSYTVDTSAKITAVTPPGTGAVAVTVRSPGGTSNSVTYTYAATPSLTTVSPNQGPASGGTTVTLTGTGLTGATAVAFGGNPAITFTVNSATQITAVAPAGTGAVPVTVTAPGGTSNTAVYTYVAAPVLTALSPALGPTDAGAGITLTGTALTTTTTVSFGAVPAAFTVLSDTTVVAQAPAGPAGPIPVTVTTAGGVSNSRTYTRVSPPGI
jgi:hypothetical protein